MVDHNYVGYDFFVKPLSPAVEILIAQLGAAGFESFIETEQGVSAYISKNDWNEAILNDIQILNSDEFKISFSFDEIEQTNWNAEWEKNFHPIEVDGRVTVRAPFHEKPATDFDIVIEPKMSFGTGHHETTHMMIAYILNNDFTDKKVLDMGCGTGVLAILAEMKGAKSIDAIDYDNWCYLNSIENVERNQCKHITVLEGDAKLLENRDYQVILANINRNILLRDMSIYVNCLNDKGTLFLSGFYKEDKSIIISKCKTFGLEHRETLEQNNWVALKLTR